MRKLLILLLSITVLVSYPLSAFAAIDEEEPNDSKSSANSVLLGTSIYGDTPLVDKGSYSDNVDWFKFNAPINGTIKITIWTDGFTKDESDGATAYVYDSNSKKLTSVFDSYNTSSGKSQTFPVSYGKTYYVKIYGSDDVIGIYRNVSYHFKLTYQVGKTSITKIKGSKNGFKVSWDEKNNASCYEIQYIEKDKYEDYGWKNAKKTNISGSKGSKTVSNLAKKKAYYVRIRVGRAIEGNTYYSSWSSKKSVVTK